MHQGRTSPPASPERLAMAGRGLRRGVLIVRRESKPTENAARREKNHFRMETS